MLRVSGIGFDTKNKIITRENTYNVGDKVVKVEELQTRDLGKFLRITEFRNGKKVKSEIKHLDKDVFEKAVKESKDDIGKLTAKIALSCEEDN